LYEDKEFEFPENFFDDYQGRGTADHTQKMSVVQDMMWGHNMKFKIDPYTGEPTGFETDLKQMDEKQRAARLKAYNSRNEAFLKNKPEGKDLAKWKYQRYLRDYLKCIQSVDDGVGQVLDYLDKNGLPQNTIVVYTSDLGFYLGEHSWFDKRFMYEESFRIPLAIWYPKKIKAGAKIDKLVLSVLCFNLSGLCRNKSVGRHAGKVVS
jgi:arylsulfatase A-like enzyme